LYKKKDNRLTNFIYNARALSGFSLLYYNYNFKTMVAIEHKSIVEISVRILVSVYQKPAIIL